MSVLRSHPCDGAAWMGHPNSGTVTRIAERFTFPPMRWCRMDEAPEQVQLPEVRLQRDFDRFVCQGCVLVRGSDYRTGLLYHLDEGSTRALRRSDFRGKVDASALDSIVRLQPKSEAEPIDRGHRCLDRFDSRM